MSRKQSLDEIDNILVLVSEIDECQGALNPDEMSFIENAVPKRVREFTAGRHIARHAMRQMGIAPTSIPVDGNRCPVWPEGVVGSISHTNETVGIALARTRNFVSIGFDIEAGGALTTELHDIVLTNSEKKLIDSDNGSDLATLLFSGKESVYKAVYPMVDEFLEFLDIEIRVTDGGFSVTCLNNRQSNSHIAAGNGYFEKRDSLVMSLFLIDRSSA